MGHGGVGLTRECDSCDTLHDKGQPRRREGRASHSASLGPEACCGHVAAGTVPLSIQYGAVQMDVPVLGRGQAVLNLGSNVVCLVLCLSFCLCVWSVSTLLLLLLRPTSAPISPFQPSIFPRPALSHKRFFSTFYYFQFSTSLPG